MRRPAWTNRLLLPLAVLLFSFLVPIGDGDAPVGVLLGVTVGVACVAAVVAVLADEATRQPRRLRPVHLVLALEIVIVVFCLGYYLLATRDAAQFEGLSTRLDALYFTMTMVSTVGFGDITATGQLARVLVTLQMAFNLLFIAALVRLFQQTLEGRRPPRHED